MKNRIQEYFYQAFHLYIDAFMATYSILNVLFFIPQRFKNVNLGLVWNLKKIFHKRKKAILEIPPALYQRGISRIPHLIPHYLIYIFLKGI